MSELVNFIFNGSDSLDPHGIVALFAFVVICELLGSLLGSMISASRG